MDAFNLDRSITRSHTRRRPTKHMPVSCSGKQLGSLALSSRSRPLAFRAFSPSSRHPLLRSLPFGLSRSSRRRSSVRRHTFSPFFSGVHWPVSIGSEPDGDDRVEGSSPFGLALVGRRHTYASHAPFILGASCLYSGAAKPGLVVPRGAPRTHHLDPAGLYAGSWLAGTFVSDACCFLSPRRPAAGGVSSLHFE